MGESTQSAAGNIFIGNLLLPVVVGVSIFVLGEIAKDFILKPLYDYKEWIGNTSHKLKFHANTIASSGVNQSLVDQARGDMRDLSCNLESRYMKILCSKPLSVVKFIPDRESIKQASKDLILLSNTAGKEGFEERNFKTIEKIKDNLKIIL